MFHVPRAWIAAKRRQFPEAAFCGLPALSQAASPVPGFQIGINRKKKKAKMSKTVGQGPGKPVQRKFKVGGRQ